MHADEIKERIEREQKLMKNTIKQMAKLSKNIQTSKNYIKYLEGCKNAKKCL